MRIVVIGTGRMGSVRAEDLAADPRVDDLVVSGRRPDATEELAASLGGRACAWEDWPEADGYVVTTATDTHAAVLERLVGRGRPILVEKPLAMTLAETDALISMAGDATVQVGFQRHFDRGISRIKESIDSGHLGTVYTMTLTSHDKTPGSADYIRGSGGTFRDMLVHDLELASWLVDSPLASVYATGAVRGFPDYASFDDYDVVLAHVVTESGVQVAISGTRHDPVGHDIRLEVFGSLDSIAAGLNDRTPLHLADGELGTAARPYLGFIDRFRDAFQAETAAFVDVIEGHRPNPCTPQQARDALCAAIACEVSAREGRPVLMADVR